MSDLSSSKASHLPKRPTLVRTRVGCVKASTYDLPAPDHTYGYSRPEDPEGVGAIISNWVTANPSLHKETEKRVVYSNVLAIKNGCVTAKSMHQYGVDHPNIRLKESLTINSGRSNSNHEGPFGAKTKFSEDSMGDLLQGRFVPPTKDDYDYPDISMIKKTGLMPKPKSTIASDSILQARERADQDREKKEHHFVMKKFQNIEPTMTFTNSKLVRTAKNYEE